MLDQKSELGKTNGTQQQAYSCQPARTHTHTYTRHVAMLSLRMADFNGHIEGDEIDRGEEGQISPSEIHDLESRILTTGL
jgi:hypothetical protein